MTHLTGLLNIYFNCIFLSKMDLQPGNLLLRLAVPCVETLPELVDFIGRTENVLIHFQHVNDNYQQYKEKENYK